MSDDAGARDQPDRPGNPPPDSARRLLARARRAAPAPGTRRRRTREVEQEWSGARPDGRDPTAIGDVVGDLVREQNWTRALTAAGIAPRWEQIVGSEVAAHCRPERLEAGELTCVAESTAWATQLRLLNRQILNRLTADLGPGVVTKLRVHGPTAPDWRHGPLRVTGRGPRDTYG